MSKNLNKNVAQLMHLVLILLISYNILDFLLFSFKQNGFNNFDLFQLLREYNGINNYFFVRWAVQVSTAIALLGEVIAFLLRNRVSLKISYILYLITLITIIAFWLSLLGLLLYAMIFWWNGMEI